MLYALVSLADDFHSFEVVFVWRLHYTIEKERRKKRYKVVTIENFPHFTLKGFVLHHSNKVKLKSGVYRARIVSKIMQSNLSSQLRISSRKMVGFPVIY